MNNIHHLAMTAADFFAAKQLPAHLAWMSCHFSSSNPGISNLPGYLPPNAVLILDDSTPFDGHDPVIILTQLRYFIQELKISCVLLDFQRPYVPELQMLTELLVKHLPCAVSVAYPYAEKLDCPVFLPPPKLHCSLESHITPWKGREIWLELAPDAETITVTEKGSIYSAVDPVTHWELPFTDTALCCKYRTDLFDEKVRFTLCRDWEMMETLQKRADAAGIPHCISLYRQVP